LPDRPPERSALDSNIKLLFSIVVFEVITPSKLNSLIALVISEVTSLCSSGDSFIKIGLRNFSFSRI
jgi:hypothetical protein